VRERRCFVQFIHPAPALQELALVRLSSGEHCPDRGDRKFWNRRLTQLTQPA